jgi:hypothetical protein
MLSFDEIEDCFPEGGHTDNMTGKMCVSAQWLHDFAHAVSAKERKECAKVCEETGKEMSLRYGDGAECLTTSNECAEAIRLRSNV